jgi:hypothetical protein
MRRAAPSRPPAPVPYDALDRAMEDLRASGGGIVKLLGHRETARLRGGPYVEIPARLWQRLVGARARRTTRRGSSVPVEWPDGTATTARVVYGRGETGPCVRLRGLPPDSPWLHDDYVGVTLVLVRPAPDRIRVHFVVTDDDREELGAWFGFELVRGAFAVGELASPGG